MSAKHFDYQEYKNDIVGLHLIERHGFTYVEPETVVGYCHCDTHPGYICKDTFKKHDCIGKQCVFFEKFNDFPYWISKEREKQIKKERRLNKKTKKSEENNDSKKIIKIADKAIEVLGYPIIITRVAPVKEKGNVYIINYVSNQAANDWYKYKDLIEQIQKQRIGGYVLKHTKKPNGEYATIYDWNNISKKIS